MYKKEVAFSGAGFFQPIRALWKLFKLLGWLDKSQPHKKATFLDM